MLNVNKLKLSVILLLLSQSFAFGEPRREETINFINKKMKEYGYVYWAKNHSQTKIKLTCNKSSGNCQFIMNWNQDGSIESHSEQVNLGDLDIDKVDIVDRGNYDDSYYIRLYCKDEKKECVNITDKLIQGHSSEDYTKPGIYFYIKYKSQAIKVKKALIHLIKFYDKKELF